VRDIDEVVEPECDFEAALAALDGGLRRVPRFQAGVFRGVVVQQQRDDERGELFRAFNFQPSPIE
jgi:hypothetical protein